MLRFTAAAGLLLRSTTVVFAIECEKQIRPERCKSVNERDNEATARHREIRR